MTEHELRKLESLADDVDTMCDTLLRKADAIAVQYTLHNCGISDKKFAEHILDLIKIRLTMRIEKEIFGHDN